MSDAIGLSGRKVLLLEDEVLVGMCLADALEEAGLRVCGPITTRAEALGWLEDAEADLAVLDLGLADGPALDVARELRRRVPFVIFSGSAWHHGDLVSELGNPPVVEKPACPDAVLAGLALACAAATAGRAARVPA